MAKYNFIILLFLFGCSNNEIVEPVCTTDMVEPFCTTNELEIISDEKSCEIENDPFVCEILEIIETQFIDKEAYDWSPGICDFELQDQIKFINQNNSTFLTVVDRGHYISKERIQRGCNEIYEHKTYICQKNEVIFVSFLNDHLGEDTLTLSLRTMTVSYEDQTPGAKENIINLYQKRTNSNNTNIINFWLKHFIGDDYYEQARQSFNSEVTLNGKVYHDVVKYEYMLADPDIIFYLQKGSGLIGFEVDRNLWLRE